MKYFITEKKIININYILKKKIVKKNLLKKLNIINKNYYINEINLILKNLNIKIITKIFNKKIIVLVLGDVNAGKTSLIENLTGKNIKKNNYSITQNINIYNYRQFYIIDTPGHELFNKIKKKIIFLSHVTIILLSSEKTIRLEDLNKTLKHIKENCLFCITKIDLKTSNSLEKFLTYNFKNKIYKISSLKNIGTKKMFDKIYLDNIKKVKNATDNYGFIINFFFDKNEYKYELILKTGYLEKNFYAFDSKKYFIGKVSKLEEQNKIVNYCFAISCVKIYGLSKKLKIGKKVFFLKNKKYKNIKKTFKKPVFFFKNKKKPNKKVILISNNKNSLFILKKIIQNNFNVIYSKIGDITEVDMLKNKSFKSIIINYSNNTKLNIDKKNNIYSFNLIYDIIDFFKKTNVIKNKIQVIKIFKSKTTKIYGVKILKGSVNNKDNYFLKKNNVKIKIVSIKIKNKKFNCVSENKECGIVIKTNSESIIPNDLIVSYLK
ncbi:GTP-binding protein [Candidatus Vidania fulgoroideorum]